MLLWDPVKSLNCDLLLACVIKKILTIIPKSNKLPITAAIILARQIACEIGLEIIVSGLWEYKWYGGYGMVEIRMTVKELMC